MSWQNSTTRHPFALRSLAARPRWSSAVVRAAAPTRWFEALERRSHLSVSSDLADDVLGLQGDSASVLDLEHTPASSAPAPAPAPPALGASGASEENESSIDNEMPTVQIMPVGHPDVPPNLTPTRSRADFRFNLRPGNGFAGPTIQPPAVGNPADFGYDAKAIARWDVVPFQTFTGRFEIGVVAFHINGIDRVDFAVNGGDWSSVRHMTFNRQTNVNEYTITLNAADFADGLIEVRAVAWPTVGEPRVLAGALTGTPESARGEHSMFLNTNANGTLPSRQPLFVSPTGNDSTGNGTEGNPLATIERALKHYGGGQNIDGLTIYLTAGTHAYGETNNNGYGGTSNGWVTITPAPSATRDQVTVVQTGQARYRVGNIRLANLQISGGLGNYTPSSLPSRLWLDGVDATGYGRTSNARLYGSSGWVGVYVTDSRMTSYRDGFIAAQLVRNSSVNDIGSDGFTGSPLVLNSTADRIDHTGTSFHADVYQFSVSPGGKHSNFIVYGLVGTNIVGSQGLFADDGGEVSDVAFVNVALDGGNSQWKDVSSNHLLFWHTTLNSTMTWRTSLHRNVSLIGNAWQSFNGTGSFLGSDAVVARTNHFVNAPADVIGTDVTTGTPGWDSSFIPGTGSPLLGRVGDPVVNVDANGRPRSPNHFTVGAFVAAP